MHLTSGHEIHVLASPFPSQQGTQGCVKEMALARAPCTLVTYGHGDGNCDLVGVDHIKTKNLFRYRDLRSRPSLGRGFADAELTVLIKRLRAKHVTFVAHNVEAALCCIAAGVDDYIYVAHTLFETELGLLGRGRRSLRTLGKFLDHLSLVQRRACAVSPWLAKTLQIPYAPIPWTPKTISRAPKPNTLLYAGNLDAYQGLDVLIAAYALLSDKVKLNLLTASDHTSEEARQLKALGANIRVLDKQAHLQALAHTTAVIVPRKMWGGLPVKLLDALAIGLPTVATPPALAGLKSTGAIKVRNEAHAMAQGITQALAQKDNKQGRSFARTSHSAAAFSRAFDRVASTP